jgi:serine/threonine-protein kinase PknG
VETGTPRPGASLFLGADLLALEGGGEISPVRPEYRYLPMPLLDVDDAAAQAVSGAIGLPDATRRTAALRLVCKQVPKSREARLRLAASLSDEGKFVEAEGLLKVLGEEDAWDWRVLWYQGRMMLAQGKAAEARKSFDQVYFDLPGEVAPKLALGLAAELAGELAVATKMYDLVSRTDPGFVSAVFGLARCRFAAKERRSAVAALERIPSSSSLYLRSRVEAARMLVRRDFKTPEADDLTAASAVVEGLSLDGMDKFVLQSQVYREAVQQLSARTIAANAGTKILGQPLMEGPLRMGLEEALRSMARLVNGEEKIRLIDQANEVRPRSLV